MQSDFISLESIQIASPCRAKWSHMRGDDRVRFCRTCEKNVYNLSAMSREEAMRLIEDKEGLLCVRLHRRSDGTVITNDCSVEASVIKEEQRIRWVGATLGFLAALLGLRGVLTPQRQEPVKDKMGSPMITTTAFHSAYEKPLHAQTNYYGNASGATPANNTTPI